MKHRCRKLAWGIVHAAIISSQFTSTLRAFENTADKSSSKHEPLVLKSTASDESAPVATNPPAVPGNANPAVRIVADAATPQLAFLGVDTERGERVAHN